ncbi:MAG: EamA family transporter [Hyphomicrobiaceae bacterium]|nr:EamA family transporter [Hyphomicrobiaceae bacterium]
MLTRIAPLLFVVLWSTGFIASKISGDHAEPFTFLSIRFAIAAALLFPAMLKGPLPSLRSAGNAALVGALIHSGYIGPVMWALRQGMAPGVVAMVVCLQPLATALLAGPLLGEHITRRHWLGLALGLAGTALVLAPKMELGPHSLAPGAIDPLAVIAAVVALASITVGTLYQKTTGSQGSLTQLAFYQYIGATALALVLAFTTETRAVDWTMEFVLALAWLVVVLSIGAIGLLLMMIRASAVSRVTSLFFLVPATTALMGWALLGDRLETVQLLGMALVMAAVAMIRGWKRP